MQSGAVSGVTQRKAPATLLWFLLGLPLAAMTVYQCARVGVAQRYERLIQAQPASKAEVQEILSGLSEREVFGRQRLSLALRVRPGHRYYRYVRWGDLAIGVVYDPQDHPIAFRALFD